MVKMAKLLNPQNWEKWLSQFPNQEGSIRLPKFKMDYEIELQKVLTTLGMGEAFTTKADFSGMGENLALSNVKHKTFVEIKEEGTEAAATTSVGVVATSRTIKPKPFEMIVDRPFFCSLNLKFPFDEKRNLCIVRLTKISSPSLLGINHANSE